MAFSRKDLFNLMPQLVASMSRPMGHPARVKIIMHLLEHGETRFKELTEQLPLSGPTISQHLRLLRRCNLIDVHESTPHTIYGVNRVQLQKHMLVMFAFLDELRKRGINEQQLLDASEFEE